MHLLRSTLLRLCLGTALLCMLAERVRGAEPADMPLSLDEAIRLALAKNYSIRIQSYGVGISEAGLTEALGRFDVRLQASYTNARDEAPYLANALTGIRPPAEVTDTDSYRVGFTGALPTGATYSIGASSVNSRGTENAFSDTYVGFAGISVTQPLLKDGGTSAGLHQIRIAKTNRLLSDWEYRRSVTDIVTQVIYAFSELHFAQARLRSAKRSYDLAMQLQKENERRFSVGERSEYEIISAKARVASREESILGAERHVEIVENLLKQLISDKADPELLKGHLLLAPLNLDTRISINAATDFRTALEQRPDYRIALLGIRKGELDKGYARNQALPRVDLVGSYGYNGIGGDFPASRSDLRDREFGSFSTGVVMSVPLGSLSERGRYKAAKLRLLQAQAALQQLEQSIVIDIGNAAMQVESARKRMLSTRTARELNEQTLQAEIKRLRAGTGSTFSVLYQQEQLNGAEINEALSKSDYRKALAEYDRQIGRTLSAHNISLTPSHNVR